MKKKVIIEFNLGNFGSTGTIMREIAEEGRKQGYIVYLAFPKSNKNQIINKDDIVICSPFYLKISRYLASLTGYNGCFSIIATYKLLRKIKKIKPDLFHFHNLHDSYINLPMLFAFIKKHKIPVVWTLHDCWAFTGHCPYFIVSQCYKWKTGCYNCPQLDTYPISKTDKTKYLWKHKRKWFTGINNMTLVTPSQWLAKLVKQSYLSKYPVSVINNGIDLDVFKPTISNFRTENHINDKYILIGVAFDWEERKGLDVFIELSRRLNDQFQIVLIGTDDKIDRLLPNNIISIHRTSNQEELAKIYSSADLFVNPTREENYPTVNMESIACGTPVLTFRTGGSPEILDAKSGYVVEVDDIDEMEKQIIRICTENVFSKADCIERSKSFDKKLKFRDYINLYDNISSHNKI